MGLPLQDVQISYNTGAPYGAGRYAGQIKHGEPHGQVSINQPRIFLLGVFPFLIFWRSRLRRSKQANFVSFFFCPFVEISS